MEILAGRMDRGTIRGSITYNNAVPSIAFLRRVVGYVQQFGTLVENLTVFEMLMYTAELKVERQVALTRIHVCSEACDGILFSQEGIRGPTD